MKRVLLLVGAMLFAAAPATANDRYAERPPVVVSPDLSAPWLIQLGHNPGKVREIGCSNFSTDELRAAEKAVRPGKVRFMSVQNEYSVLHREPERGVLEECRRAGLAFIPYFPLASGLLTGKYRHGQPPPKGSRLESQFGTEPFTKENLLLVESLLKFATSRGRTLVELAMSWLASRPAVASVIAGATSPDQVKANAASAGWRLSEADLAELDRILSQPTGEPDPHGTIEATMSHAVKGPLR